MALARYPVKGLEPAQQHCGLSTPPNLSSKHAQWQVQGPLLLHVGELGIDD